jgi:hypothetical protein
LKDVAESLKFFDFETVGSGLLKQDCENFRCILAVGVESFGSDALEEPLKDGGFVDDGFGDRGVDGD